MRGPWAPGRRRMVQNAAGLPPGVVELAGEQINHLAPLAVRPSELIVQSSQLVLPLVSYALHARRHPRALHHDGAGLYSGLPQPFEAGRYHSLIVASSSLPAVLHPVSWTAEGELMGVRHREKPAFGVQFHPESIATQHGHQLLANFLDLARVPRRQRAA